MRSLLFVPADHPRKLDRARGCGADALIIDLEDSVAFDRKAAARDTARAFLAEARQPGGPALYVRVNALDSGLVDTDLDVVMRAAPDGIVLPKSRHGADVQHLGAKLAVHEAENAVPDGCTKILPIATETPAALFGLASYAGASRRLAGLCWGAEDLSAGIGAEASRDAQGILTDPFRLARALALFAAHAADVDAIDTVHTGFRDLARLAIECDAARRDGFTAKLAIHPAQVPVINAAFTPSAASIEHARRIVAAFAESPGAGVLTLDGEMIDLPHLKRAERVLARAGAAGTA
jgi:citrate lyase subunit beta/citryl-CoA lyase